MATRPPVSNGPWRLLGILAAIAFLLGFLLVAATDIWPWAHEVIVQQSWKPVCDRPDGTLYFCRVWGS